MRTIYLLEDEDYLIKQQYSFVDNFSDIRSPATRKVNMTEEELKEFYRLKEGWIAYNAYLSALFELGEVFD